MTTVDRLLKLDDYLKHNSGCKYNRLDRFSCTCGLVYHRDSLVLLVNALGIYDSYKLTSLLKGVINDR